jgi:hypothetical protein
MSSETRLTPNTAVNSGERKLQQHNTHGDGRKNSTDDSNDDDMLCCFCGQRAAALNVKLPVLGRKKRTDMPYCLRCYYTSSAVRQGEQNVSIRNKAEQERQLPAIQTMFSECFLELQEEICKVSMEAFSKRQRNHDPLAVLLGSGYGVSKKKQKSIAVVSPKKKAGNADDGGFLRTVDIPERLKKTQQHQARVQQQQLARMSHSSSGERRGSVPASTVASSRYPSSYTSLTLSNRRKGSRKSIWNLAMDQGQNGQTPSESHVSSTSGMNDTDNTGATCTSCGSKDVNNFGNITSRKGDVRKGEIWGTDRDASVVTRYQCNHCGRTWNEEE